ncbi:hypothetical protein CLOLEP_03602 [[Clostridium] leptum DSM 753]|uniref:Uncharacterized protein n=1 Tax=[Clostridium] leptum DSM 753 TaxID=428125 RepID=A7VYC4_9FIRM|nr:hypothetical protein CLOLEP_03602 [[Clostridium] leptum DSM 753]PEQ25146.1 hypothetical protein CH238_03665 [[Clostridium] leptum DSM 753]
MRKQPSFKDKAGKITIERLIKQTDEARGSLTLCAPAVQRIGTAEFQRPWGPVRRPYRVRKAMFPAVLGASYMILI